MGDPIQICYLQAFARRFVLLWIATSLLLVFSKTISAGGILDPNFGTGGKVNFRFGGTSDQGTAAALQSDGKIVIVGLTGPSGQSFSFRDFAVARLNTDGSLDGTFGTGGLVTTGFGSVQEDIALAVVIQPDGKIVAGGTSGGVFALARYNTNGSLDAAFGTGGRVTTDFTESLNDSLGYLFLQSDGKIVAVGGLVTGSGFPEGQAQIGLVRYNADGGIDTTFGNNGKFKIFFGNLITYLDGAAMQADGKLVIAGGYVFRIPGCVPGPHTSCEDTRQILLRYNTNMTPDRKFGRRVGKEFSRDKFYGLSLQTDGQILTGGYPLVRRYSSTGRFETLFDQPVFPNQPPNQSIVNGPYQLTHRPNGTIVGCKFLRANGHDDIGVVLFDPNGHVVGTDQRDFFTADDSCAKVLLQADGKILVVGRAQLEQQGNHSFAVMRYLDITP